MKLTDTIYPWLLPTLRSAVRLTRFLYLITSMPAFDTLHQQLCSAWSPADLVLSAYAWLDIVKAASKFPDAAFTSTCLEYRDSSSCGWTLIRLCASTQRHLILLSPGLKDRSAFSSRGRQIINHQTSLTFVTPKPSHKRECECQSFPL